MERRLEVIKGTEFGQGSDRCSLRAPFARTLYSRAFV